MADLNAFAAAPPLTAKVEPQPPPPPAAPPAALPPTAPPAAAAAEEEGVAPRPAAEQEPREPPQTLVFIDAETTGLPESRPRATELCFIAVDRHGLGVAARSDDGVPLPPRIHDKLTFCLDPQKVVDAEATRLTGLSKEKLVENRRRPFDGNAARLVRDFLARQASPVCLVAHNGMQFDFPLLKDELSHVGETLPPGTLCADTLPAMRQIMAHNSPWPPPDLAPPAPGEHGRKRKLLGRGRARARARGHSNDYCYEEMAYTPRRQVAFGKKNKFRLGDLYVQFFGHEPPVGLHNAETDTMALLSVAQHCAPQLLAWVDLNARPIADVQPLYQPPAPARDAAAAAAAAAAATAAATAAAAAKKEEDDDVIVLP